MVGEHGISVRQGCKTVSLVRSTYRYEPKPRNDDDVIDKLNMMVEKHPAIGFWKSYHRLRNGGDQWNHKRVYRVYKALGLNIRRRAKKATPCAGQTATVPTVGSEPGLEPRLYP